MTYWELRENRYGKFKLSSDNYVHHIYDDEELGIKGFMNRSEVGDCLDIIYRDFHKSCKFIEHK